MAGYVGRSTMGPPNVPFTSAIASILAKYFPMSGFKPLQPTRLQPLYFPTWFVHAELKATGWLSSEAGAEEPQSRTITVQFEDLYLPGINLDFGRILVRDPPQYIELAKPFSPNLAHQWGHDVMCLPYNILPFDILDKSHTLSYTDAVIDENMRFNPQSVKMNLAACYPVLLPVYLAQYVSREPWPPVTIILAAHSDPGVHYIHIPHPDAEDNVRLPFEELVAGQDDYIEIGSAPEDAQARAIVVNPAGENISDGLSSWLNDKLQQRNAPVSLAARHPIDLEDPRVREWTQEEVDPVYNWLRKDRARTFFRKEILKNTNLDESEITTVAKVQGEGKFAVDLFKAFLKGDAEWQETRAASVPEWWKKWEESQKPRRSTR
ncbi:hypothetical protein L210DRAFT_3536418 [Boletus edulis BED1]|uniref:Uncharacterized protein n=1 Tax=Boletus edulis BED1 TaxID=1328754 RepID=A0AAD4GH97_BOLED|nr:hypothetical protein L210DRAFT_3536418 [Boletus edulis BED1]